VFLVGFTTEIYYDARPYERQTVLLNTNQVVRQFSPTDRLKNCLYNGLQHVTYGWVCYCYCYCYSDSASMPPSNKYCAKCLSLYIPFKWSKYPETSSANYGSRICGIL